MSIITIGAIGARGNAGVQSLDAGAIAATPGDGQYTVTEVAAPSGGTGSYTVTLYESTTSGQLGSSIATDPTYPYQRSGRSNGTTYYVTPRVSDGVSTVDGEQVSVTPSAPSALHPNEPAGMTQLMQADGSVAVSGGNAFGLSGWSNWYGLGGSGGAERVSLVSDASNPTGSGSAVRRSWRASDSAAATADFTYPGGPFRHVYIALRVIVRNNPMTNHKFYYHITSPNAVGGNSGPWPTKEGATGGENFQMTACGVDRVNDNHPDGDAVDTEMLLEWLWDAGDTGVGDGSFRFWVNGTLLGPDSGQDLDAIDYSCYTSERPVRWRGIHFYGQANSVAHDWEEDIRELYISARN